MSETTAQTTSQENAGPSQVFLRPRGGPGRATPGPWGRSQVIVVGGGPVGLVMACELGRRGVAVTLIDDKDAPSQHPKANTHNARAMEIYRRIGIADALRRVGLPPDRPTDVLYCTRVLGDEIHRVPMPSANQALALCRSAPERCATPEPQLRSSQRVLEPLLVEQARSHTSVRLLQGWRAASVTQDATGVSVDATRLADGRAETLRADWVVGCDGGRSLVREAVGIKLGGESGLRAEFLGGRMSATYFRAPGLAARLAARPTWMYWILQAQLRAILVLIDPTQDQFLFHFRMRDDQANDEATFREVFYQALGDAVPCEVISSAEWRAGLGLVADQYRAGRCLLAGDAVHLFTPAGGFGLNTGVEDAFNLGWKLAAVCRGWGDPALLDSYEQERRPIGLRNTAFALRLARRVNACPVSPAISEDDETGIEARKAAGGYLAAFARWEFETPGIQLGARYDGSSVVIGDGGVPPDDAAATYTPSGVPGGRLPHAWLADGSAVFDRLGAEFTLLCFDDRPTRTWSAAADAAHVPLTVLSLPNEEALHRLCGAAQVLVRPDQHIAWRGHTASAPEVARILATVTGCSMPSPG